MHALDTDTKQANITSNAETQTGFPKQDWVSLVTPETPTEGKSTLDAMTQTERVYSSNRNGDTAQECINIDMIKLLKDEIAFLCGELSWELGSNQKTIEVLLEQHSHYQTHQKKYDEFQHNNQNQSTSYKNSQNKCTQFDPSNSYTRQPSKSLLKSANTTSMLISVEKENTIKVKEKVILVGDSISGVNGKGLSTDKFTTVVCDIPGATSDDIVHLTIPFAEKNPEKLIVYAGTNDIYRNMNTIGKYEKIYNYVKANAR